MNSPASSPPSDPKPIPPVDDTQNITNLVVNGTTTTQHQTEQAEAVLKALEHGIPVRRVKKSKLHEPMPILVHDKTIRFPSASALWARFRFCGPNDKLKELDLDEIIEVRQGYGTDGLHKAAKKFTFQESAPEAKCFSIVYRHPKYVSKAVDFVADSEETKEYCVKAIQSLLAQKRHVMSFDEKQWLVRNFKKADLDRNGQIAFDELWKLLKKLNLQMSRSYVRKLYDLTLAETNKDAGGGRRRTALNQEEFMRLFNVLSDLPEYTHALLLANNEGEPHLNAEQLQHFLQEEQGFEGIDIKKAESIIHMCEPALNTTSASLLTTNGFRRLMQSRWGNILKQNHESTFMDMTKPMYDYFISSSHNTYLTGLQVRGEATVEGYISALRKGARLLELDVFDGESEPVITHKRTFISAITLRNTLKCINKYAFETSPYPVILTIENHVGFVQQKIMAEIFEEELGSNLYLPPPDAATKPLPSPHELRHKFILRGKNMGANDTPVDDDPDSPTDRQSPASPRSPIEPSFGRLIGLPSVKLTANIYQDIQDHPMNGSPSLSESKVKAYLAGNAPIPAYAASRLIKSYPAGIRQDSSNMNPVPSWVCGVQCAAMNLQTAGEDLDLANGLFAINGQCGYILKPKILRDGLDPRQCVETKVHLHIAIICAQYLPKADPQGSDIVDPYVTLEMFGIPLDMNKSRTRAIRNNGFNPVWNENFEFNLRCPELAILRFCVKDFDSTSSNDFVGEYTIPVASIRTGYSHIRLNTGFEHNPDEAASLFVRVAFETVK